VGGGEGDPDAYHMGALRARVVLLLLLLLRLKRLHKHKSKVKKRDHRQVLVAYPIRGLGVGAIAAVALLAVSTPPSPRAALGIYLAAAWRRGLGGRCGVDRSRRRHSGCDGHYSGRQRWTGV
jgi:hypothetical protein